MERADGWVDGEPGAARRKEAEEETPRLEGEGMMQSRRPAECLGVGTGGDRGEAAELDKESAPTASGVAEKKKGRDRTLSALSPGPIGSSDKRFHSQAKQHVPFRQNSRLTLEVSPAAAGVDGLAPNLARQR